MSTQAQMVATFTHGGKTHAIEGEFRYDRNDNRTQCGRPGPFAVEHWQSGRPIEVTCQACRKAV